MSKEGIQLGLVILMFGGFVWNNSPHDPSSPRLAFVGFVATFVGLLIGIIGYLDETDNWGVVDIAIRTPSDISFQV